MIFICSPLAGDIENNLEKAKKYCRFATEQNEIPIAPHLYFTQFLDETNEAERTKGITMGLGLLRNCDAVWVFGERISAGMFIEITEAEMYGIPIIRYTEDCTEPRCVE